MPSLKKLSARELRGYLPASDISSVKPDKEPVYKIEGSSCVAGEIDPLINVEISLRGGDRVGLFTKKDDNQR